MSKEVLKSFIKIPLPLPVTVSTSSAIIDKFVTPVFPIVSTQRITGDFSTSPYTIGISLFI